MSTLMESAIGTTATAPAGPAAACRLCPPDGGTVVASFSGDGPSRRAGDRAWAETRATGITHHDHYDPVLDAFMVIRHQL
jgi:hypothetical protein